MEETSEPSEPQKTDSGNGANYWVIGVITLVIVVGIIWFASSKKQSTVSPTPAKNSTQNTQQPSTPASETQKQSAATIEYTNSGFSPQSVIIKSGDTITFKNSSSSSLQVASAPHPVHTDRPELNAPGPMPPGETFSTVITEKGTWKFHNHLDPAKFGSVTVQ
jgi:plastocyanin